MLKAFRDLRLLESAGRNGLASAAIGHLANDMTRQLAAEKEKMIRSELRRLKTHRMNVRLVTRGLRFNEIGEDLMMTVTEDCWVERLLPPGPRPLP